MFKCKECGCEYEEKPDFCDCGNDCFDEIIIEKNEQTEIKEPKSAKEFVNETKIIQPEQVKKSFSEQNSKIDVIKKSIDLVSLGIFITCIILSFVIIFFVWNPKEEMSKTNEIKEVEYAQNIPSIEKFWNNSLPKISELPKKEEKKTEIEQVQPVVKQTVVQPAKAKSQVSIQKKQVQTNKNKTIINSTKTPSKSTVNSQNNNDKTKQEAEQKAKLEAEQRAKQEALAKAKQEAETKAKQAELAKQELAQYKANLRNTLGHKIDFTKVVGDGSCTVSFKLDSTGKLINRSFAKQSTNITLNDAVYNAIMATPRFNPPPSAYANETLNLYIKFYNGNFEITLK